MSAPLPIPIVHPRAVQPSSYNALKAPSRFERTSSSPPSQPVLQYLRAGVSQSPEVHATSERLRSIATPNVGLGSSSSFTGASASASASASAGSLSSSFAYASKGQQQSGLFTGRGKWLPSSPNFSSTRVTSPPSGNGLVGASLCPRTQSPGASRDNSPGGRLVHPNAGDFPRRLLDSKSSQPLGQSRSFDPLPLSGIAQMRRDSIGSIRDFGGKVSEDERLLNEASVYISTHFGRDSAIDHEFQSIVSEKSFRGHLLKNYSAGLTYRDLVVKTMAKIFDKFRGSTRPNEAAAPELVDFITRSPRGELHIHLSGSMSPKDCIEMAIAYDLYFDSTDQKFHCEAGEDRVLVRHLANGAVNRFETLLSMYEPNHGVNRQTNFHDVCKINESITNPIPLYPKLLINLTHAAAQSIEYTEIMVDFNIFNNEFSEEYMECFASSAKGSPSKGSPKISPQPSLGSSPLSSSPPSAGSSSSGEANPLIDNDDQHDRWLKALNILRTSGWLNEYVTYWTKTLIECNEKLDIELEKKVRSQSIAFKPEFRYLIEIMRDTGVNQEFLFFATMAAAMAFERSGRDNEESLKIVGINVVGPEHDITSRVNFVRQIEMSQFLQEQFDQTKISVHAGEFGERTSIGASERAAHLGESLKVASRIGHGTAIPRAYQARKRFQESDIPVEICITSNEATMGIDLDSSLLWYYLDHGISVILGSDDPGIFGSDLVSEYLRMIKLEKCNYHVYKNILRNALHYSFLGGNGPKGESIFVKSAHDNVLHLRPLFWGVQEQGWQPYGDGVEICENSLKAKIQVRMEQKMAQLESEYVRKYARVLTPIPIKA